MVVMFVNEIDMAFVGLKYREAFFLGGIFSRRHFFQEAFSAHLPI